MPVWWMPSSSILKLGQVGRPVKCDASVLEVLVKEKYVPLIACLAGDSRGGIYNVNADQMAVARQLGIRCR